MRSLAPSTRWLLAAASVLYPTEAIAGSAITSVLTAFLLGAAITRIGRRRSARTALAVRTDGGNR